MSYNSQQLYDEIMLQMKFLNPDFKSNIIIFDDKLRMHHAEQVKQLLDYYIHALKQ